MRAVIKKRVMFWGLAAIFLFPTLLAFYAYFYMDKSHWQLSNKGTLLTPVVALDELAKPWGNVKQSNNKKWRILLVGSGRVSQDFKAITGLNHRLLLLGKDMSRTRIGVIADANETAALFTKMRLAHLSNLEFYQKSDVSKKEENFAYLVDPIGNVILSYKKPHALDWAYRDLKHLLKVSNIG